MGSTGTSETKSNREQTAESDWSNFRSEVGLPGYWKCLEDNCRQWADEVFVSPFWKEFDETRSAWSNEFNHRTGGALLAANNLPRFCGKGASRVKSKLVQLTTGPEKTTINRYWPLTGPPVPQINDLVRTRIECQFLDGVEFIATKLQQLAEASGIRVERTRQGKIEGYFAQHLYFDQAVLFRFGGGAQQVTIQVEVQIATQLATRVWLESHGVYEQWRGKRESRDEWQWQPLDPRFIARQLGHMIHLADGLLVHLRESSRRTL